MLGVGVIITYLIVFWIVGFADEFQALPRASSELQDQLQHIETLADHGRPAEQGRLQYDGYCSGRNYSLVLRLGDGGGAAERVELERIDQPGQELPQEDVEHLEAVLGQFSYVGAIDLHCWRNGDYRYRLQGRAYSPAGPGEERQVTLIFHAARFERAVVD